LFFNIFKKFFLILYESHRIFDSRGYECMVLRGNLGICSWWNFAFVAQFNELLFNIWITKLRSEVIDSVVTLGTPGCLGSAVASVEAIFFLTSLSCNTSFIEECLPQPYISSWGIGTNQI